jgi:hypothetical protein
MLLKNRREHERLTYSDPVRISWEDEQGLAHAKCVDVSEDGIRIEVRGSVPVRTRLLFRADLYNFDGSATVRIIAWRLQVRSWAEPEPSPLRFKFEN